MIKYFKYVDGQTPVQISKQEFEGINGMFLRATTIPENRAELRNEILYKSKEVPYSNVTQWELYGFVFNNNNVHH